jgi:hypothetical protein
MNSDDAFNHTCCTQRNNQKDSTTAIELQDLQDLQFLHNSVCGLRDSRWEFNHLNWDEHVTQLEHEGQFSNEYLMSESAHKTLLEFSIRFSNNLNTTVDVKSQFC